MQQISQLLTRVFLIVRTPLLRSRLLDVLRARVDGDVVGRTRVVRDGIDYVFEERASGTTLVYATRRTRPLRQAVFLVDEREKALAWMDDGVVPEGEIRALLPELQAGTWPESLRSTSRPF